MLALLLSLLSLVAPPTPPTISPADAAQHVGEFVMVQGTVDQVSVTTRNGTFLDFGGRYPNYTFTAVIFAYRPGPGRSAALRGSRRLSSTSRGSFGRPSEPTK